MALFPETKESRRMLWSQQQAIPVPRFSGATFARNGTLVTIHPVSCAIPGLEYQVALSQVFRGQPIANYEQLHVELEFAARRLVQPASDAEPEQPDDAPLVDLYESISGDLDESASAHEPSKEEAAATAASATEEEAEEEAAELKPQEVQFENAKFRGIMQGLLAGLPLGQAYTYDDEADDSPQRSQQGHSSGDERDASSSTSSDSASTASSSTNAADDDDDEEDEEDEDDEDDDEEDDDEEEEDEEEDVGGDVLRHTSLTSEPQSKRSSTVATAPSPRLQGSSDRTTSLASSGVAARRRRAAGILDAFDRRSAVDPDATASGSSSSSSSSSSGVGTTAGRAVSSRTSPLLQALSAPHHSPTRVYDDSAALHAVTRAGAGGRVQGSTMTDAAADGRVQAADLAAVGDDGLRAVSSWLHRGATISAGMPTGVSTAPVSGVIAAAVASTTAAAAQLQAEQEAAVLQSLADVPLDAADTTDGLAIDSISMGGPGSSSLPRHLPATNTTPGMRASGMPSSGPDSSTDRSAPTSQQGRDQTAGSLAPVSSTGSSAHVPGSLCAQPRCLVSLRHVAQADATASPSALRHVQMALSQRQRAEDWSELAANAARAAGAAAKEVEAEGETLSCAALRLAEAAMKLHTGLPLEPALRGPGEWRGHPLGAALLDDAAEVLAAVGEVGGVAALGLLVAGTVDDHEGVAGVGGGYGGDAVFQGCRRGEVTMALACAAAGESELLHGKTHARADLVRAAATLSQGVVTDGTAGFGSSLEVGGFSSRAALHAAVAADRTRDGDDEDEDAVDEAVHWRDAGAERLDGEAAAEVGRLCLSAPLHCSVCSLPARGPCSVCPSCGHGGHPQHLSAWFAGADECPAGCGCRCQEWLTQAPAQ